MANDDIDLKQQVINPNKGNNDFLKTIIINVISTTILCVIFIGANFVIQTNLLNSKRMRFIIIFRTNKSNLRYKAIC